MIRPLALALMTALAVPGTAQAPAALPVGADCVSYAKTHTLVRNDVLAKLDAADQNLPKAEAALKQAQDDLQALKHAADQLQGQKTVLQDHIKTLEDHIGMLNSHIKTLEDIIKAQPAPTLDSTVSEVWETLDAPASFLAGAGVCMGVAWGLRN